MSSVTLYRSRNIITSGRSFEDHELVVEGGRVLALREARGNARRDRVVDLAELTLAPGLVDIHVHGGGGFDTLDGTADSLRSLSSHLAAHGVTTFLPTTVSASKEKIDDTVAVAREIADGTPGARFRGLHLEGPYICTEQAGAQPLRWLRDPDPDEYVQWFASGVVSRITIAPELRGVEELLRLAGVHGVQATIGHSACSAEQASAAIDQGARQATHVFSGMPPMSHRNPGVLSTVLGDDRVFAEAIVDGVHIHPKMVALLLKILGPDRMVLVSDAMRATGLGDGTYALGDQEVVVRDGVTHRPDGGLAGSVLTLDAAVRNIADYARLPLPEAIRLATETPARAMGWDDVGSLREGSHADFVALDRHGVVARTWVGGELVYSGSSDALQARADLRDN